MNGTIDTAEDEQAWDEEFDRIEKNQTPKQPKLGELTDYPEVKVVVSGPDRSGKSTISMLIASVLSEAGIPVTLVDPAAGDLHNEGLGALMKERLDWLKLNGTVQTVRIEDTPKNEEPIRRYTDDYVSITEFKTHAVVRTSEPVMGCNIPADFQDLFNSCDVSVFGPLDKQHETIRIQHGTVDSTQLFRKIIFTKR